MNIVNKAGNFPIVRATLALIGTPLVIFYVPEFIARIISWQW